MCCLDEGDGQGQWTGGIAVFSCCVRYVCCAARGCVAAAGRREVRRRARRRVRVMTRRCFFHKVRILLFVNTHALAPFLHARTLRSDSEVSGFAGASTSSFALAAC